MPQNMSNFDNVLREFYEGAIRETLNNEVPVFKVLDESDRPWAGRRVVFPVHTARSTGVGARAEGGTLPTAGNQTHQLSVVSATYNYGRIQVTGPVMRSGKNAFAESMAVEMEGMTKDLRNDLSRQTWGTGDGKLFQVSADAASATAISVFNRFSEPGHPGLRFVVAGDVLDFGDNTDPNSDGASQTVISVAISSNPATTTDTLTISNSALDISSSDTFGYIVDAGGNEMMGLQGLLDQYTQTNYYGSNAFQSATVQNISRATVSRWNTNILANSGTERVVDSFLVQTAFDRINENSGFEPNLIFAHHDVVRAFLDSVAADRRYVSTGAPAFDGGFSSLSYNGVPIMRDRHAPYNTMLVCRKEALKIFTLADFEWASDDGAILSRVTNQDAFEAFLRVYKNLGIDTSPLECAFIRDIKVDF